MAASITAAPDPDRARVELALSGFPDSPVTVYRVAGGVRREVRAANPIRPLGGTAFAFDYEAPLGGVPLRYEATDAATGTIVVATTALATNRPWVKSPAQPALNTAATFVDVPSMETDRPQTVFRPLGRSDAVVVSDVRSSLQGEIQLRSMTAEETARIRALLNGPAVVLLQVPETPFGECYAALGRATPVRVFDFQGPIAAVWTVGYAEVAHPPGGQVGDLSGNWQTLLDEGGTWGTLNTPGSTWLGLLRGDAS